MINAHFAAAVPNLRIMEIDIDHLAWDNELVTHSLPENSLPRVSHKGLMVSALLCIAHFLLRRSGIPDHTNLNAPRVP